MASFALQISNFEKYGTFSYRFDEVGNVILNPSSSIFQQHFIDIPLSNVNYDNTKITSFYDVEFTEFTKPVSANISSSVPTDVMDQINNLTDQNAQLTDRLNNLIAQSELDNSAANQQLVRDIILPLRIQLGQGTSAADFQTDFPYLPIPVDQRDNAP
jgi:hypothetical protein